MHKRPNSVKLGTGTYHIVDVKDLKDDRGNALDGQAHEDEKIEMDADLDGLKAKRTFFHELVHTVDLYLGEELGEKRLTRYARTLFDLLYMNPDAPRYCFERPDKKSKKTSRG
jgi:hypothetical protein